MLSGHIRRSLSGEIVKFDGRDALPVSFHSLIDVAVVVRGETCLVDSGDDFLRDGDRVNVVRVETITESAHACRDLTNHLVSITPTRKGRSDIIGEETNLVKLNSLLSPISLHTVNIPSNKVCEGSQTL